MITFFKELGKLIKMLFTKVSYTDETPIIVMKHFPFKGYSAMMWCGNIITRNEKNKLSATTQRHELIHLKQARIYGSWIKFYFKYICEWIKGNPIINPSSSAYYTIPFEVEAYANQHKMFYEPTTETIKRYTLKNRKSTYREHRYDWRQWIKNL